MDTSPVPPLIDEADGHPPLVPLEKLTYPLPVKILAIVTAVAFLLGLIRAPHAIGAGVHSERGAKAASQGRYDVSEKEYAAVVAAYPEAKDDRIGYAEACAKTGDLQNAVQSMLWFEGKKISAEEDARLTFLENDLKGQIEALQKAGKLPPDNAGTGK